MKKQIRITFPDGGSWSATGFGLSVEESEVASHVAGNSPHCALITLIEPVIESEPGDEPMTLGDNEWEHAGWDGDVLVYNEVT